MSKMAFGLAGALALVCALTANGQYTEDWDTGVYVGVFADSEVDFAAALQYCEDEIGTTLASIHSSDDNAHAILAASNAATADDCQSRGQTWIGFNDLATEETFVWTDGSAADFTNWQSNAPNDFGTQDCTVIESGASETQWNDLDCVDTRESFVCNWPQSDCAGCGSHVVGGSCAELTSGTGYVFGCPSTASTLCGDAYHVCQSASEASALGLSPDDCGGSAVALGGTSYLVGDGSSFGGVLCCVDEAPTSSPTEAVSTTGAETTSAETTSAEETTQPPNPVTYVYGVAQCGADPCSCDEEEHCKVCQNSQDYCSQCQNGYFKIGSDFPCAHCQAVFGDGCKFCQDNNGCGQCGNGYNKMYDSDAGLYYCA